MLQFDSGGVRTRSRRLRSANRLRGEPGRLGCLSHCNAEGPTTRGGSCARQRDVPELTPTALGLPAQARDRVVPLGLKVELARLPGCVPGRLRQRSRFAAGTCPCQLTQSAQRGLAALHPTPDRCRGTATTAVLAAVPTSGALHANGMTSPLAQLPVAR
jgi:hypothetical protein